MSRTLPTLISPATGDELRLDEQRQLFTNSSETEAYPIESGVVRFMTEDDPFYEAAYMSQVRYLPRSERWYHTAATWLINSGYVWTVRRHLASGAVVLELGGAAGVAYFGRRYQMISQELSLAALKRALPVYAQCLQCDARRKIPLVSRSVDGIVSSYFWEHLTVDEKRRVLEECTRVLRPGGKIVFLYDVATENPLIARFRAKDPEKYRQLFLDNDGHVGYETPQANAAHFRQAGLRIEEHFGMERTPILMPSSYEKLQHWGGCARPFLRAAARLCGPPWLYPYVGLVRAIDTTVGRLFPLSWSRIVISVCRKPG